MDNNNNNSQFVLHLEQNNNEETGGISLKSAWAFIKLSFIRAVIFVAVAAILATFLVIIINQTRDRTSMASATIELVYSGAEEGKLPGNATGYFVASSIISPNIIDNALASSSLSETVIDAGLLRHDLSVIPEMPQARRELIERANNGDDAARDEIAANPFVPIRFVISLESPEKHGLSESQAERLITEIVDAFTNNLISTHIAPSPLLYDVFNVDVTPLSSYRAHEIAFYNELNTMRDMLLERAVSSPNFRAHNSSLSFGDLLTRISALINQDIFAFRSFVSRNGVATNPVWEISQLTERNFALTNLISQLNIQRTELQNILNLPGMTETISITIAGVTTTTTSPTGHAQELQRQLTTLTDRIDSMNLELFSNTTRITRYEDAVYYYEDAAEHRLQAAEMLDDLSQELIEFTKTINTVLQSYHYMQTQGNIVRTVLSATYTTSRDNISRTNMVLIFGAFILTALIAAFVVTHAKRKSAMQKAAQAQEAATQGQQAQPTTAQTESQE